MQTIRSLLVVIEPELMESLALERAKYIARTTKAHLHLLICDKKHEHADLLSVLEAKLADEAFNVTSEQAWHESRHATILQVQQAKGCGLVIKQHVPDNPLKKVLLTPEDWKLLRYCPCPVLLVKTHRDWEHGVVLAAVDVGNNDPEHMALHSSIVDHGFRIASLAHAQLHVISAHPAPTLAMVDEVYPMDTQLQASYRAECQVFQQRCEVEDDRLHIEEGPADMVIPRVAKSLGAVVTVMGTVARTGLSGALIGNTAEVVIDKLDSDILVLKPDDMIEHLEELAAKR
ncbi:Nucleotide-binding universal stress protein, UspA family [Pseudomonas taetrolens]|uniref:Nucleotide-binding universal stress protein, UspA family n=1 Tax=Pseudomonas taetrolens TaxID=47884 RepID=A0A0J6GNF3_PSETA|nr:universal stress protein [Pseudomonas taetrolens]KMM86251.1 universal stress protein UspA [Pseudomonas taetrolens]SEC90378.1 Nucleotide-binding universal stress protein, UspA family [Pseudomonas taetrolens]SQF87402.1 universal stress protein E [Pseudomonas taetrolens]VEH50595.1 universal stress protein E [Pseudomonas taetrolens]